MASPNETPQISVYFLITTGYESVYMFFILAITACTIT